MIENLILGAGPAGCQLAYFFSRDKVPYVVLERQESAGSFFQRYPQSGKLISINKKYTGSEDPDFALRHDWNSLLSDEPSLRFTSFSDDYYPDKDDLHIYLNRFASHFNLNIRYGSTVTKVQQTSEKTYIVYFKQKEKIYKVEAKRLIVATGLGLPVKPKIETNSQKPILHYAEFQKNYFMEKKNLQDYVDKSLLIVGNGNSAYELANLLTPYSSSIVIHGRRQKEWASSTHYTGDLRSVYLPYLDTFLLKSLNAWNHTSEDTLILDEKQGKYHLSYICKEGCLEKHAIYEDGFDEVIFCTGWKFDDSIFDFELYITQNEKYPLLTPYFEAINNPNLFFIGSLGHASDYKRSSGGFIHGFRYLIQFFYSFHFQKKFVTEYFSKTTLQFLVDHILHRINTVSSLYQMYGVISDIFYEENSQISYIHDVVVPYVDSPQIQEEGRIFFVLTLEYGKDLVTDIYDLGKKLSDIGTESKSALLHPVLRILKLEDGKKTLLEKIHFDEDILAKYTKKEKYGDRFLRVLRAFF